MNRDELEVLKHLVNHEKHKVERIKELLGNKLIMEYLYLSNTAPVNPNPDDIRSIIAKVLPIVEINESVGLYVCTNAYKLEHRFMDEICEYYQDPVPIDSPDAEYKIYGNIETREFIKARNKNIIDSSINETTTDFENKHIVLNPTNSNNNMNKFQEVQLDFFENAINIGQGKSKQLILKKYSRL